MREVGLTSNQVHPPVVEQSSNGGREHSQTPQGDVGSGRSPTGQLATLAVIGRAPRPAHAGRPQPSSHISFEPRSSSIQGPVERRTSRIAVSSTASPASPVNAEQAIALALQHPGQAVELELMHVRASDLEIEGMALEQHTPNRVLMLHATRAGEIKIHAPGEQPRLLNADAEGSGTGASHAGADRDALANALDEHVNARVSYSMAARVLDRAPKAPLLPGPGMHASSSADRHLTGVARWSNALVDENKRAPNHEYGLAFWQSSRDAGEHIASGHLRSFRELWHHAADWRASRVPKEWERTKFLPQKVRDEANTTVTPLRGQYEFVVERMQGKPSRTIGFHSGQKKPKIREFRLEGEIAGKRIPLTNIYVAHKQSDMDHPAVAALRRMKHANGELNRIEHTAPEHIEDILNHVETLFSDLTARPHAPDALLRGLAEIHWWAANAMPDPRGSAAKAEWSVRALAQAHGVDLPPFKTGVQPDLEAMMHSRESFIETYPMMFERSPQ